MYEPLVQEYERGAEALQALVRDIPANALPVSPSEDAWSIHEILVHLSDAEIVYSERLRRAIGDETATVASFDESAWGDRLQYANRDASAALGLVRALRTVNADLLRRLDAAGWERTVTHSEAGPISVARIVQTLVEHVDYHLAQIRRIRDAENLQESSSPARGAA